MHSLQGHPSAPATYVTPDWPIRTLHSPGDRDWLRDGHVAQAEPMEHDNFCNSLQKRLLTIFCWFQTWDNMTGAAGSHFVETENLSNREFW